MGRVGGEKHVEGMGKIQTERTQTCVRGKRKGNKGQSCRRRDQEKRYIQKRGAHSGRVRRVV